MNAAIRRTPIESAMTPAAQRSARTRQLKKMIAAAIEQAHRDVWTSAFYVVAAESPRGSVGAYNRWFQQAWRKAGAP